MSMMGHQTQLTSLQSPEGHTLLIDNRIGSDPADQIILTFARRGAEEGYTVLSDHVSNQEKEDNVLHICTLLRPGTQEKRLAGINIMAALAATHAIERNSDLKPGIRWVNRVYADRKKIADIKIEAHLLPSGYLDFLILHTRIILSPSHFSTRLSDTVSEIFTGRRVTISDRVAQAMTLNFFTLYEQIDGLWTFLEEYRRLSSLLGKHVRVKIDGKKRNARALRIDDQGRLVVSLRRGVEQTLESASQLLT